MLGTFPSQGKTGTGYIKNIQHSLDYICRFAECSKDFKPNLNDPGRLFVEGQNSTNA